MTDNVPEVPQQSKFLGSAPPEMDRREFCSGSFLVVVVVGAVSPPLSLLRTRRQTNWILSRRDA